MGRGGLLLLLLLLLLIIRDVLHYVKPDALFFINVFTGTKCRPFAFQ
jgi:hypothetical protein